MLGCVLTLKVDVTVLIENDAAECLNKGHDMDMFLVIFTVQK